MPAKNASYKKPRTVHLQKNQAKKFLSRPKNFLGFWIMKEKREKSLYQNDLRRILVLFHELFGGYSTRQIGLRTFFTTIFITTAEMCLVMAKYSNSRVVKQTSFFMKHSLRKDVEKYLHSSFGLVWGWVVRLAGSPQKIILKLFKKFFIKFSQNFFILL